MAFFLLEGKMSIALSLSEPLDVVDAAISYSLHRHCEGWSEFTRDTPALGRVIYRLYREDLGNLGEIELRKLGEEKTVLEARRPKPPPGRDFTPEELHSIRSLGNQKDKHQRIVEIHSRYVLSAKSNTSACSSITI